MRVVRWFMLAAAVPVFAACAPDSGLESDEEDQARGKAGLSGSKGTVMGVGNGWLNVRKEASTDAGVVDMLKEGATVFIGCQTEGESVGGNKLWNYLPEHDGFASDVYIYTGYDGRIPGVPDCEASQDDGTGGPCGSLDYIGECSGDVLRWCDGGAVQSFDCSAAGDTCGYQDDSVGYNCLAGGGDSGERLTVGQIVGGDYSISQAFGFTDFWWDYSYCEAYKDPGGGNFHCATDISVEHGRALYVPEDGTVVYHGNTSYYEDEGNPAAGELRIRTANGTEIILGHMSQIEVWAGDTVTAGQYAGRSGTLNGPHLHLEVRAPDGSLASGFRALDPMTYFGW